jgi:hypothetical protein
MDHILTQLSLLVDLDAVALAIFSFVLGIIVMLLDSILFALGGGSFLKIPHKEAFLADLPKILLWSLGSGIVGLLGGICKIFNTQGILQSSLLIALAWPIIIRNLIRTQSLSVGTSKQDGEGHSE